MHSIVWCWAEIDQTTSGENNRMMSCYCWFVVAGISPPKAHITAPTPADETATHHFPTSAAREEGEEGALKPEDGVCPLQDQSGSSLSMADSVSSLGDDDWVNLSSSTHPLVTSND